MDEIAAGIGKIDEIDKEAGKKILHRYQAILVDIEKLPDSDQKTYYLDFHREMIADLKMYLNSSILYKNTGNSSKLVPVFRSSSIDKNKTIIL